MVVGDRPPASLTSSRPDPAVTATPWPAEPGGVCRTGGRSRAIIRSAPVAGKGWRRARRGQVESACRKSHDQPARVAHDAARQGDQMKPHRLHAPRRPIAAEHQTLHHRVEIVGENHDRPPRRIGPEQPARQPPAGEIVLHHGVRFLALAAALALPADQFVARQRAVGDEAEQLVAAQRRKAHRREGQLLGIAEIEFTQRLADRQKAVVRRRLAHARPVRHVADFRPLLAGGIALAIDGRVGDWRAGLGRSLCSLLARSFVCECHTISAVPRFQPPPRRTQHADFPHCALLFASPQDLWDLSCRSDFRFWANHSVAIEQLQSLVQPSPTPPRPAEALSVPGSQHMAPDLLLHPVFHEAEALAGVSHRKVVHPTAQHRVDQLHDPINRLRLVAAEHILELA